MVTALKVHHFKPDGLPAEMILVPKEDINLDLANGGAGQAGYDAVEHSPGGRELLRLDVELLQGVKVQDVDAAPAVYQHAGETGCASVCCKGGIQDQCIRAGRWHHLWVVSPAPADGFFRPVHVLGGVGGNRVDFLVLS